MQVLFFIISISFLKFQNVLVIYYRGHCCVQFKTEGHHSQLQGMMLPNSSPLSSPLGIFPGQTASPLSTYRRRPLVRLHQSPTSSAHSCFLPLLPQVLIPRALSNKLPAQSLFPRGPNVQQLQSRVTGLPKLVCIKGY